MLLFESFDCESEPAAVGAVALGLKPGWFALSTLFDVFNSHRPPRQTLSQRSLYELVEIPVKYVGGGARDVPGAKVFHHLIGLEHIRAYLVAPPNIGLRCGVRSGLLFKRFELSLIEPSAQHVPGGRPVLVL